MTRLEQYSNFYTERSEMSSETQTGMWICAMKKLRGEEQHFYGG